MRGFIPPVLVAAPLGACANLQTAANDYAAFFCGTRLRKGI